MYFDSVQAFLAMGGHGPYVWAAYAISWSVLIALLVQPIRKRRQVLKAIKLRRLRQGDN